MDRIVAGRLQRQWKGRFKSAFDELALTQVHSWSDEADKRRKRAFVWAKVILCDLLATAAAGPAYVYSFARFSAGYTYDCNGISPMNSPYPSIVSRLLLCLDFLSWLGFSVNFNSRFIKWEKEEMDEDLGELVMAAIREPYTPLQHESIWQAQGFLMDGRPAQVDPVTILNSLWEAVVSKRGYINEIAALVSLGSGGDLRS
jgi:hypothetical protein